MPTENDNEYIIELDPAPWPSTWYDDPADDPNNPAAPAAPAAAPA